MTGVTLRGPRDLQLVEREPAHANAGEAVVSVIAAGICGSDLHGYAGVSGRRRPGIVLGHEVIGRVIEAPDPADAEWVGQAVAVQPLMSCQRCEWCTSGDENLCDQREYVGIHRDGGMADELVVPVANLVKVPPCANGRRMVLAEPLAVALHAVRRAGPLQDRTVGIVGGGAIGLLILALARRAGAGLVWVSDVVGERLDLARAMGADRVIDAKLFGAVEDIRASTGGCDVAIDAVGTMATFGQALRATRKRGRVVAVGGWRPVELDLTVAVPRELSISGSFNFHPIEFDEAVGLTCDPSLPLDAVVTDVVPLEDAASVFARLVDNPGASVKVVLTPSSNKLGSGGSTLSLC